MSVRCRECNRDVDIRCPTSDSGCDELDERPSVRAGRLTDGAEKERDVRECNSGQ